MSVWIELRCDKAHEDCANPVGFGDERSECWSHNNSTPADMGSATQKGVIESYKYVSDGAKKAGWKKIDGEWVCPHCIKQLSESF